MDLGWSELLLIGIVALIVIGPKDLPHLFRQLGRFTAKARSMAREFTSAMEDAAKSSGLDEASNSIREVRSLTSKKSLGLDALDRAADKFEKWDPMKPAAKPGPTRDPGDKPAPTPGSAASPAAVAPAVAAPAAVEVAAADPNADDHPAAGKRRIHAVRRSDMKDD
ncbi:twin-arginine translocase subunit TatB [Paracoccus sp. M683]|uniref:Sec-independent protein translocase protein TatB n=1 Tax=Paracoccus sp. M683 TaxID=2594268 RepID=UPI00117C6CF0|nr:Sec-independent protein translocase protein TatB [Paracoccus sp. M683]TRW98135.1 twin-arginine translocase subunit TatB [Paracoccus sp. M683]